MNTAATELECFQELQKQEQMAGAYRVRNLAEEVDKQKALERNLQSRYGDFLSGYQRIQEQLEEHKRQLKLQEEAMEAEKRAKEAVEAEKLANEEAVEAEKRAKEEAIEAEKRAKEEAIEAEKRAKEEEAADQSHAAEEENERKSHSVDEESAQMARVTDEEPAGSKEVNGDQMDMDNSDKELVGPIPPVPDTQVDNDEASVQQITDNATTNDGACDKVDSSKSDGQENTNSSMDVDSGSQEEGKNALATESTHTDVGNTAVSSDQAASNEENAVPE
jgi:pre-mRNA-splicing factor CDC5/CEF1